MAMAMLTMDHQVQVAALITDHLIRVVVHTMVHQVQVAALITAPLIRVVVHTMDHQVQVAAHERSLHMSLCQNSKVLA